MSIMSQNKSHPEIALLNRVTDLLMDNDTKNNEREILLYAKHQLEHHVYLPNLIWHLKNILTPLAIEVSYHLEWENYTVILLPVTLASLAIYGLVSASERYMVAFSMEYKF